MATFSFVEVCTQHAEPLTEATIREVSRKGARLRLKSPKKLPERLLVRSIADQSCRMATVKWVSGVNIGLEFVEEASALKSRPDADERIRVVTSHLVGRLIR